MKQLLIATATLVGSSVGQYQKSCNSNFDRLFAGPADVRSNAKTGDIYTDRTFYRMEQLFWNYWTDKDEQAEFVEAYRSKHIDFVRLADKYPAQRLWDGTPAREDVMQGEHAHQSINSALSALSQYPQYIERLFVTKEANEAGAYLVNLYFRAKPWTISIDDHVAWDLEHDGPWFSQVDGDKIWAILLEKAFAKAKGTYSFVVHETTANSLRALTGAPVEVHDVTEENLGRVWLKMEQSQRNGYAMTVHSRDDLQDGGIMNSCGLEKDNAYQVLTIFDLFVYKLVILRSVKGTSIESYVKRWNFRDTKNWYQTFIDMIPGGINPFSSWKKGIFFMESVDFATCFDEVSVVHLRDGYENNWYDMFDDWGWPMEVQVEVPERSGDLYFGVETYPLSMYRPACMRNGNPSVTLKLYQNDVEIAEQIYEPTMVQHILVKEQAYNAKDIFKMNAVWTWTGQEYSRAYTFWVYSGQNLELKDWRERSYEWYRDGDQPNEVFWSNSYRAEEPPREWKPKYFGPKALPEVIEGADDFWHGVELFWNNFLVVFWWWRLYPY